MAKIEHAATPGARLRHKTLSVVNAMIGGDLVQLVVLIIEMVSAGGLKRFYCHSDETQDARIGAVP